MIYAYGTLLIDTDYQEQHEMDTRYIRYQEDVAYFKRDMRSYRALTEAHARLNINFDGVSYLED